MEKLKIVINTNTLSAGTKVCVYDMSTRLRNIGHEVILNDWNNYNNYSIAMFMGADSDIKSAKKQNNNIKAILMDPKLKKQNYDEIMLADMLLVSSIEQREKLYKYNDNIYIYYMFPDIPEGNKIHDEENTIRIVYNGNKQHLHSFYSLFTKALEKVSKKTDKNIELNVIYNIEQLGLWTKGLPKNIKINHIQWTEENQNKYINQSDIAICPNLINIPLRRIFPLLLKNMSLSNMKIKKVIRNPLSIRWIFNILGLNRNDYVLRFKNSTNPGRIYVFAMNNIPVITDFAPSSCQIIRDRHSGSIVGSVEGAEAAILELIEDHNLRNKYANNLRETIEKYYSKQSTFDNLIKAIENL